MNFKKSEPEVLEFISNLHCKTKSEFDQHSFFIRRTIAESFNGNKYRELMHKYNTELDCIYAERVMNYDVTGGQNINELIKRIKNDQSNSR